MQRQICALAVEARGARPIGWPTKRLTWDVHRVPTGLEPEYFRQDVETALDRWSAVCGIEFAEAGSAAPNLLFTTERLGGPLGTLGIAQMPYLAMSAAAMLKISLDKSERWTHGDAWTRDGVPVAPVLCHEIGHAIGLPHAPAVAPPDLMDPSLQEGIVRPQTDWDIATAQQLYGPPQIAGDPAPEPDPRIGPLLEAIRDLLRAYLERHRDE